MSDVLGPFVVLALMVYFMFDLERKRQRLARLVSRLERLSEGEEKQTIRSVRGLTVSAFFPRRLIDRIEEVIDALERSNGIDTPDHSRHFRLFSKKLANMEDRVEALEKVPGS